MKPRVWLSAIVALSLILAADRFLSAQTSTGGTSSKEGSKEGSESRSPSAPAYANLLREVKNVTGMWTLYQKGNNLYWEVSSSDYSSEYIVLISISRGIAQGQILGGMSWGFGDDWVWQFRKVGDNVHVVRKNVRFKATPNSPESKAVAAAYTDSVLFSLPIMMKGPKGGDLVDVTQIFMSDLPQIGRVLPGFNFSSQKSSWAAVKGFDDNMELEVAATYASSGMQDIDTVADSRGVTINVHYSVSKIPNTGYQPRPADDRVGYFLTVVKDFSNKSDRENFVRYINRWDLQKADSSSDPSPPKKPIVFHIEKTVPFKLRKAIYDGIYEWNKAFEKAGFVNAIEVHQQLDNDTKDPEDVRYNFFRWITSNAGFAMGPSRVNPYTGQILDADIIFDADFLTSWKQEYETFTARTIADMTGGELEIYNTFTERPQSIFSDRPFTGADCTLAKGMSLQLAFGHAAIMASSDPKATEASLEKLIQQGLKEVTMHEVGHTLGLRHNFKGSKWMGLKDMNDSDKNKGSLGATVMDYNPSNIVPKGIKQGDYFSTTLGPYDYWAIEYGYKAISGDQSSELKKIASKSGDPALAYSTDEDTRGTDPDPDSNRFDLGSDPLEYANYRISLAKELIPGLVDRMTKEGDDYTQARRAFNVLLAQYGQSTFFVSRYVGGLQTSRSHKGDKDAKPPVVLVDAKLQRDALACLEENIFSDKNFKFSPELLNQLGWSNWNHWGTAGTTRKDFGIHEFILQWQERILEQLLSSVTLRRMHDTEFKSSSDADILTTAELIQRLTKAIFSEVETTKEGDYSNRKPAISSLRRNLQRSYLRELSELALGTAPGPQDCQTIAYAELSNLQSRLKSLLDNQPVSGKLDAYSRAHLQETSARIGKVLDAKFELPAPSPPLGFRIIRQ